MVINSIIDFHLHILRVEGGHRVVDIDQEVFPTLNVPSGEPGRGGSKINVDEDWVENKCG